MSANSTEIHYSGRDHHTVEQDELSPMVRADRPIPKHAPGGQFYFEVSIVNAGSNREIAVGICVKDTRLDTFPGWEKYSFGYHGDDGNIYCESDDPEHHTQNPFSTGDTIGVCLNFNNGSLSFSKNRREVKKVQLSSKRMGKEYYPSVGISSPGAVVRIVPTSTDGKICCFI